MITAVTDQNGEASLDVNTPEYHAAFDTKQPGEAVMLTAKCQGVYISEQLARVNGIIALYNPRLHRDQRPPYSPYPGVEL